MLNKLLVINVPVECENVSVTNHILSIDYMYVFVVFTMQCTTMRSAVLQWHVVSLSVCDVGGSWPHHLLPGEHGEILWRKCSFNAYVHNVRLNWLESTESHVILGGGVAVCLFTFVGASHGHVCDHTAFFFSIHVTFLPSTDQWSRKEVDPLCMCSDDYFFYFWTKLPLTYVFSILFHLNTV